MILTRSVLFMCDCTSYIYRCTVTHSCIHVGGSFILMPIIINNIVYIALIVIKLCRSVLFGQWGFGDNEQQGITVLFHGQPGTGKTLAAEALGYEVGKPLKVC